MEELDAIALLKIGDLNGLEPLVDAYYLKAVRAADLILGNQPAAEDIVQSAFLHAAVKIHQLNGTNFKPWFMKIVVNDALKTLQLQKRTQPLEEDRGEDADQIAVWLLDQSQPVETMVETAELRRQVWQALQQLTPNQRASVVMKYYLEMTEKEITQALSRPLSSVKWYLHAARAKLRSLLLPHHQTSSPSSPDPLDQVNSTKEKDHE